MIDDLVTLCLKNKPNEDYTTVRKACQLARKRSRFALGFATVPACLHHLTESNKVFVQTSQCDVVFQYLKQGSSQAPVLDYSTSEGSFILDTDHDGSNTCIGAVLSQKQGEDERVIACFGPLARKELLFLVTAVRPLHHYVHRGHTKY